MSDRDPQGQYGQQPGQYGGQQGYGQQQYGQPGQYGGAQYGGAPSSGPGGEPPLWAPWYGISFPKAFTRFWKKYVRFDGRASRSEFWWWILWNFLIGIVLSIIDGIIAGATGTTVSRSGPGYAQFSTMSDNPLASLATNLWWLATVLPSVALVMRRLHDGNHSGWWWLLVLIPVVGWIVLLILVLQSSKPEGQRFDRPDSV